MRHANILRPCQRAALLPNGAWLSCNAQAAGLPRAVAPIGATRLSTWRRSTRATARVGRAGFPGYTRFLFSRALRKFLSFRALAQGLAAQRAPSGREARGAPGVCRPTKVHGMKISPTSAPLSRRKQELTVFVVVTLVLAPVLAIATVGAYGLGIWVYQMVSGPPGPPPKAARAPGIVPR